MPLKVGPTTDHSPLWTPTPRMKCNTSHFVSSNEGRDKPRFGNTNLFALHTTAMRMVSMVTAVSQRCWDFHFFSPFSPLNV